MIDDVKKYIETDVEMPNVEKPKGSKSKKDTKAKKLKSKSKEADVPITYPDRSKLVSQLAPNAHRKYRLSLKSRP